MVSSCLWLLLLFNFFATLIEGHYTVAKVRCQSAVSQECVEACENAGCGSGLFSTLEEANTCVPANCNITTNRLLHWAFPVCADEEKGSYAIRVSTECVDIVEALQRSADSLSDDNDAWISIVTEESETGTRSSLASSQFSAPPQQRQHDLRAMMAIADKQIATDELAACTLPGVMEQQYVVMTKQVQQTRGNTQSFSLRPLIKLGLSALLRKSRTLTILIEPELSQFVAIQKVGSTMGLGAVELMP